MVGRTRVERELMIRLNLYVSPFREATAPAPRGGAKSSRRLLGRTHLDRRRGLRVTLGGSLRRTVAGGRTFKCFIKGLLHTLPKMLGQDFLHIVSSRVHYGIAFENVRPSSCYFKFFGPDGYGDLLEGAPTNL